jgi:mRNA-decapping enzyme subunit 2
VEQAHWYYLDFCRVEDPSLPGMSLKDFVVAVFQQCPPLKSYHKQLDSILSDWKAYKSEVPVYGCIMMNSALNKVVLVQSYQGKSWSFPRGKVNRDEDDVACAIREVMEECGFDCSDYICPDDYVEKTRGGSFVRLYFCVGIPDYAVSEMAPLTRKEIKAIQWFDIKSLSPTATGPGSGASKYGVQPFLGGIRDFVRQRKKGGVIREHVDHHSAMKTSVGDSLGKGGKSISAFQSFQLDVPAIMRAYDARV